MNVGVVVTATPGTDVRPHKRLQRSQGSATRAINSSVFMDASRMSSRNGLLAWKTSRFRLMERPVATAAVAAAASLPSSFTWKPRDSEQLPVCCVVSGYMTLHPSNNNC